MASGQRSKARKPVLWTGLALGFLGLQMAARLQPHWREAAFGFSWLAFMLSWSQLSPCAGGACAIPAADPRAKRSFDQP